MALHGSSFDRFRKRTWASACALCAGLICALPVRVTFAAASGPTLHIFTEGSGTVRKSPDKPNYTPGETVTLTAEPGRYHAFQRWEDGTPFATRTLTVGTNSVYRAIATFTNTVPLEYFPSQQFDLSFGGANTDLMYGIVETGDGGYILGGVSASSPGGTKDSPYFGWADFWIVRLDPQGKKLWDRSYGGTGGDGLYSLQRTRDGGYILGGSSNSGTDGNKASVQFGGYDFWVVHVNSTGEKIWDKSFGGTGDDMLFDLEQSSDGGFILAGTSTSGVSGNKTSPAFGGEDFWVVRLDENGIVLWDRSFGGVQSDRFADLHQTADGGFIIGGSSGSPSEGNKTSPNFGSYDYWTVRLDANGNKLWDKSFGDVTQDILGALQETADGGYILGGEKGDINGTASWVVRLRSNGDELWNRSYGRRGDLLKDLRQTTDGGYILGGYSSTPAAAPLYWLVRLDPDGTQLWNETYGDGWLQTVRETSDGGFVFGGYSGNNNHDFRVLKVAEIEAPVGTPRIFINEKFSNTGILVGDSAQIRMQTTFTNGAIFYTLDGSKPGLSSPRFSAPIIVTQSTTVRAIAYRADFMASAEADPVHIAVVPAFSVTATTAGGGSISASPATILSNSVATLVATPQPGWTFMRWTGDTNSTNATIQLLVDGPKVVQAVFGTPLTGTVAGAGSLTFTPAEPLYPYGSQVTITAVPQPGNAFAAWGNAATGINNPLTFTVTNANPIISAAFELDPNSFPNTNSLSLTVTTIAGNGTTGNLDSPVATNAELNTPDGPSTASDGTIYFADKGNNNIRFVSPSGAVGTLAGGSRVGYFNAVGTNALFSFPLGVLALRSGHILVADTENDVLRRIDPSTALVETFSGSGARGYINGGPTDARFAFPSDMVEGTDGSIYAIEFRNHTVRRIFPNGSVVSFAGTGSPGYRDGTGTNAAFNEPAGIGIDTNGNFYVTEFSGHRIRKITPFGVVSTIAGTGAPGYIDGASTNAQFRNPNGIVADARGNLFVCDHGNHVIRRIAPDGAVSTLAGLGRAGFVDGDESTALFNAPTGIALAADGSLIVTDSQNHRLRRIIIQNLVPPPQLSATISESLAASPAFHLHITGEPAARVRVETSADLRTWSPLRDATLDPNGRSLLTGLAEQKQNYYRVLALP